MKHYFTTVLTLACAALIVAIFLIKGGDNAGHQKDVTALDEVSNRLDSAQAQLGSCNAAILVLSNQLAESQSVSLALSNQLTAARSTVGLYAEQITNLNRQVAGVETENRTLNRRVAGLTNRLAGLTSQIASAETNLAQAAKNSALLEVCLRRDVAERLVVERKFSNPFVLQSQLRHLKEHPAGIISADNIYADLGVEVTSNTFHVISAN